MDYILYLLCFLLSCTICHFLTLHSRRKRNLPPGPTSLPIIGNLLSLGDKPHISLARLSQTYGPIMYLKLGSLNTIVVSSPSSAKEVMQKNDTSFSHRTIPDATNARRHSQFSMVLIPPHAEWRNMRKIVNSQVFSTSKLNGASSHLRKEKVDQLVSRVDDCCKAGMVVDIGQVVFNTTLNLLSNTFFSIDLSNDDHQDVGSSRSGFKDLAWQLMAEAGKPNLSDFFPWLKWLDPQGRRRRMGIHLGKMLDLFDGMIDERLELAADKTKADGDTLDALLRTIHDSSCEGFNREYLSHLLLDLFIAGTETTSSTIEWAMTELLRSPTKMKRSQKELQDVIGKGNSIDEESISKLPYLQAVIKETFRMHPAAPFLIPRKAVANTNLNNFTIPKGWQVLVNVWAIGKDPNVWEDVNSFVPERFLGSKIDVKGLDFELTPFGAGRRVCPGMPLAIRMLPLMLDSLIHSFDWRFEDGITPNSVDMEEKFGMALQKAQPLRVIPITKL